MTNALASFIAYKAEIDTILVRLAASSTNRINLMLNEVHGGNVGTLADHGVLLKCSTDYAFTEGEPASGQES